jgi:hypothetical protein
VRKKLTDPLKGKIGASEPAELDYITQDGLTEVEREFLETQIEEETADVSCRLAASPSNYRSDGLQKRLMGRSLS